MRQIPILLLLYFIPILAQAEIREDTFDLPLKIHQAERYLENQRFRDADYLLSAVYDTMNQVQEPRTDRFIRVLEKLAQSRSQQGKHETVLPLLQQQHQLIADNFSDHSYVYASSLSRLAEAHYREGAAEKAIEIAQKALAIYRKLRPIPADAVKLLRSNLAQYQIAPFSAAFLPLDLSEFYTRCEQLADPAFAVRAEEYMLGFVEVGVDFEPVGPWKKIFHALKYGDVEQFEGDAERRLFVPDQSISMLDEICIVEESSGVVVNALSVIE
ncbi:MAG: tetratricopeptide repeat protein [Granulosicoccus sp.]|nr:tetratricopeptide repeat protein [Granulosicoccus sp.]